MFFLHTQLQLRVFATFARINTVLREIYIGVVPPLLKEIQPLKKYVYVNTLTLVVLNLVCLFPTWFVNTRPSLFSNR